MDGAPEVHLHALVHPLAIGLGMIGRVEELGAGARDELAPESTGEHLVAVKDNDARTPWSLTTLSQNARAT